MTVHKVASVRRHLTRTILVSALAITASATLAPLAHAGTVTVTSPAVAQASAWIKILTTSSSADCAQAGAIYKRNGTISAYQCRRNSAGFYELWVIPTNCDVAILTGPEYV
jgi:hypothetical protein